MQELKTGGTPVVLLYHRLGRPKLSSLVAGQYVAPSLFKSELDFLAGKGWNAISLQEMLECSQTKECWDGDKLAITFDDGYLSVYEHACPILTERNLTGTIYIVTSGIDGLNDWDRRAGDQTEPMMSAAQIREVSDMGFEIGSHTLTHPHLSSIPDDQLEQELKDSKHKIEDIIGKEVVSFSYPYGDYDQRVLNATIAAGYKNAVTTKLGVVGATNVMEIPRINVRWNAIGPFLMRKINRARRASGIVI